MGVTKVLRKLFHGHQPDTEALSCLLDGRLDAAAGKALEEHVAACAACATRLDELHEVRTLLSAMQRVEAPRSFRLRAADVAGRAEQAPPPRRTAFAPYAAAAAVFVFALVLATDLATRDGADDGALLTASAPANEKFNESVSDAAPQPGGADATMAAPANQLEDGVDGDAGSPAPEGSQYEDDAAREQDMRSASNGQTVSDGDDGTRTEFLIAEALAGAAALGSVGWFIASRMRRSKEEA